MEINYDLRPETILSLAADGKINYEVRQLRAFASLNSPILIVSPTIFRTRVDAVFRQNRISSGWTVAQFSTITSSARPLHS